MDEYVLYWDWARHRWPSWCDRILYLDLPSWMKATNPQAEIVVQGYTALPLMPSSDHRPVASSILIPAKAIPPPGRTVNADDQKDLVSRRGPFELDGAWQSRRAAARRREIVVGLGAYLTLTWEGRGILLAVLCSALGGLTIFQSSFSTSR